ncbi:MAG: hypothetical protein RLN90_00535 [Balneolaceae bacterium]
MNKQKITKFYIKLSLINLVLAGVFSLIPSELEISDKLEVALAVNIIFHFAYQAISRFFISFFEFASKDKEQEMKFAAKFFMGFAWLLMVLPFLSVFFIFKSVVYEQAYQSLYSLIFLSGVMLGGYSMKLKFQEKLIQLNSTP